MIFLWVKNKSTLFAGFIGFLFWYFDTNNYCCPVNFVELIFRYYVAK